jgi:energy-coupling factor transporter ATP-binding protein EcfA2
VNSDKSTLLIKAVDVDFSWKQQGRITRALHGVCAEFDSERAHIICGPSGAGKSTLGLLLSGLIAADCGKVLLQNLDIHSEQTRVAYVFQFPETLFVEDTVEDEFLAIPDRESIHLGEEMCAQLGIDYSAIRLKHPYHLSGGYGRMIAIALQAARNPEVLILDEPTAALDWHFQRQLAEFLNGLISSSRILIAITHDIQLMKRLGGIAWVVAEGRIAWKGLTHDLIADRDQLMRFGLSDG